MKKLDPKGDDENVLDKALVGAPEGAPEGAGLGEDDEEEGLGGERG